MAATALSDLARSHRAFHPSTPSISRCLRSRAGIFARAASCIAAFVLSSSVSVTATASPEPETGLLPAAESNANDGVWQQTLPPPARGDHAAIYDPVRRRVVVFGGQDGPALDDLWALSLRGTPAWSRLTPAGNAPSARSGHSAIYDPVRDRIVVFGGFALGLVNEVWALSLSGTPAWTRLTPSGIPPSARQNHAAIYDPAGDRMLVFGGADQGGARNDVWALSLSRNPGWSEIVASGTLPAARRRHTAIVDSERSRVVIFGGGDGTNLFSDAWAFSLTGGAAWSEVVTAGTPPAGRSGHVAVYDAAGDRMIAFAGFHDFPSNDVWSLSLRGTPTWTELSPTGNTLPRRDGAAAVFDPSCRRMIAFGGNRDFVRLKDVWALSLSSSPAWTNLDPSGFPPVGRADHSTLYDPRRSRMIVFGGDAGEGRCLNDVWALSLLGRECWRPINASGTPPPARSRHAALYDSERDRMLVIGGQDGTSYLDDVWELPLAGTPVWRELGPSGAPPPAWSGQTEIYDPLRDRVVVFVPGYGDEVPAGVWQLTLSGVPEWSELAPTGAPPPSSVAYESVYDPVRDRMIVIGGDDRGGGGSAWALTLGPVPEWTELNPDGFVILRDQATAIYDPLRDRIVSFGGQRGGPNFSSRAFALELSITPMWVPLESAGRLPAGRASHGAIFDAVRNRMIVFGGADSRGTRFDDLWTLDWSSNRVGNPSFEAGLNGWNAYGHSAVKRKRGGLDSEHALQVTGPRRPRDEFGVNDSPSWVQDAGPAGTRYHVIACVRSEDSRSPVRVRIREYKKGVRVSRDYSATRRLESDWQPLVLDYVTQASGSMLDFQILDVGHERKDVFLVDNVSIEEVRVGTGAAANVLRPAAGERIAAGSEYQVEWSSLGTPVDSTVVSVSSDAGETWAIAGSVRGANTLRWRAPEQPTESAAILVHAFSKGRVVADGVTDLFSVRSDLGDGDGTGDDGRVPGAISLAPPRTTPSRSPVLLEFELPHEMPVRLKVFDASGRMVKTLVSGMASAGRTSVAWAGDDMGGAAAAPGIYFVRLAAGDIVRTQRIVMLR